MDDKHDHLNPGKQNQESDALEELFRQASVRQRPPADHERSIRSALHDQWLGKIRKRRRVRMMWAGSIAASIILATGIGISLNPVDNAIGPAVIVASADRISGSVLARSDNGTVALQNAEEKTLMAGQTVSTGRSSSMTMLWADGTEIRMDELTELHLEADSEIRLTAGRIYLDTRPDSRNLKSVLVIDTPQGMVRHLGTQYETRVSSLGTSVRVREGEVAYIPEHGRDNEQTVAQVGQELDVSVDGAVHIENINTWGTDWAWVDSLSPGFPNNGGSLAELISWAGRESGRKVEYQSGEAQALANGAFLNRSIDLPPLQALIAATQTTDLMAEVESGVIVVRIQNVP